MKDKTPHSITWTCYANYNKDWTAIQSKLSASPYGSKLSKNLNSMRNIISTFHHRTVDTVDLSPQNRGNSWLITTEQWKQLSYHHRTVETMDLTPQNRGNNWLKTTLQGNSWLNTTEQWKQLTSHHRINSWNSFFMIQTWYLILWLDWQFCLNHSSNTDLSGKISRRNLKSIKLTK